MLTLSAAEHTGLRGQEGQEPQHKVSFYMQSSFFLIRSQLPPEQGFSLLNSLPELSAELSTRAGFLILNALQHQYILLQIIVRRLLPKPWEPVALQLPRSFSDSDGPLQAFLWRSLEKLATIGSHH